MPASRLSIRYAGPVLFVAPVLVVVVAFGAIASWEGRRAVDDLTGPIVDQATARVEAQVEAYLATAVEVTALTEAMIADGRLDPDDLRSWRPAIFRQLSSFDSVNSVAFGNLSKDATWVIRYPGEDEVEYAIKDDRTAGEIVEYRVDEGGELGERIGAYPYDPHTRPWYSAAADAGAATWSEVYPWIRREAGQTATLGLAFSRPVRDGAGELVGVLGADVGLLSVSEFLEGLAITESSRVFLVGPGGDLLAASGGVPVIGPDGGRVAALESEDPLVRSVALAVSESLGSFGEAEAARRLKIDLDGRGHRVEVEPLRNPRGLDWRVAVVVPDADVMAGVDRLKGQAIAFGGLVTALSLALGVVASQWLVRPVVVLADGVHRIGEGDLDHRVRVGGAKEFARLSGEVNRMAEGLRERLRLRQSLALAMEIQQKLLPAGSPPIAGLDVAGHSTYCDETGGDYYDFLELDESAQGDLIVVLGDVMGHGIAAALLMATARGVLRSRADDPGSLGELLTHVNRQLEADTGGERFMTMVLMVIDSRDHSLRWASAGHDAPIVYDPESDAFLDLPNINGLPLGLMAESTYEEARRDDLGPGRIVLVGTDGIWETRNPGDEEFGKGRLRDVIRAHRREPAQAISDAITSALRAFRGAAHQDDDITFVVIKMT